MNGSIPKEDIKSRKIIIERITIGCPVGYLQPDSTLSHFQAPLYNTSLIVVESLFYNLTRKTAENAIQKLKPENVRTLLPLEQKTQNPIKN